MSSADSTPLSDVYAFLAQSMRYPEKDYFNDQYIQTLKKFLIDLDLSEQATQFPDEISAQYLEDVQVDYTKLFINGIPSVLAPPYASVYIDGSLNNKSADSVRAYYQKYEVDIEDDEFADYIVSELDFLAYLVAEEKDCEEFLRHYFRPWFTQFRDDVLYHAESHYIKTIVELIDSFTRLDGEHESKVA